MEFPPGMTLRNPIVSMRKEVAVVIPVYKPEMTAYEEISLNQCLKVLGRYPLIYISPDDLDMSSYLARAPHADVRTFASTHFQSLDAYDRLLLSKSFYDRFRDYRYMLIYQLDAFVFSDQLEDWCARGFDYVGAPWIDLPIMDQIASEAGRLRRVFPRWTSRLNRSVGNGGFSLRKVGSFRMSLSVLAKKARGWKYYEDTFWAFYVTNFYPFFRVPKFNAALEFSFEVNPAKCYDLNNHQLPFGCHAWEKYDPAFWRPFFQELGYTI